MLTFIAVASVVQLALFAAYTRVAGRQAKALRRLDTLLRRQRAKERAILLRNMRRAGPDSR